jgi:uncharacterized protein
MQRYYPTMDFPPYAFVPGLHPHPGRDPQGHSFGREEIAPDYFKPEDWRSNHEYLWGVDLYNHGYFWESHEAWEGLWIKCESIDETQRQYFQALIQLAAATLKILMKQPNGLKKLAKIGTDRLEAIADEVGSHYMGLDLPAHVSAYRDFTAQMPHDTQGFPTLLLN